jgi:hypothetical protein
MVRREYLRVTPRRRFTATGSLAARPVPRRLCGLHICAAPPRTRRAMVGHSGSLTGTPLWAKLDSVTLTDRPLEGGNQLSVADVLTIRTAPASRRAVCFIWHERQSGPCADRHQGIARCDGGVNAP